MKSLKTGVCLIAGIIFLFSSCVAAPTRTSVPMNESYWSLSSDEYKFEKYLGVQALYLPKGYANLKEVVFHNGVIEFDIAFPEGRGFPGISFRIQDNQNYEEFYVRPHQSGNPDANQYSPVFNGLSGWQLYHGDGHAGAIAYNYNAWNHVKLVISNTVGEVYINDMNKPLFQIYDLKHGDKEGTLALRGDAKAHFANFSYTLQENPSLMLPLFEKPKLDSRTISSFQVSEAIVDSVFLSSLSLKNEAYKNLSWNKMEVEYTGTLNVAKGVKRSQHKNTSLIKIKINSQSDQIKKMELGYSDRAHVFVNGKILYSGQRQFRSRDYRYLGTIGYFDAVYLDLKKGENEILIALTEAFGGWGIKARLEDLDGVQVE